MGALTENRKRCFVDLCPPLSPHPISGLTATPASKKPKIQPHPPPPDCKSAAFPPAAPLRGPVHGPQRIIRVFNLGSINGRSLVKREPKSFGMGNFVSSLLKSKEEEGLEDYRKLVNDPGFRKPRSFRMGNFVSSFFKSKKEEGLGLEDYRKLVNDSGFRKVEPGLRQGLGSVEEISPPPPPPPPSDVKVLNRKVEDARRVVEESVEVREEKVWVKRRPVYKDLYEEAKKRDPRSSKLAFELKLDEEKLSNIRVVPKVQEEKTEEVWLKGRPVYKDLYEAAKKRDRRLSNLAFELKLAEEKLSNIRAVPKVQEEKLNEDLYELFSPLTDEEEDEVSHAFYGGNRRQLLVTHRASNIEITREVLQCLTSGAWLNDEVINLYLELLKERERREPEKFLKCHFFNTFFYKKLISGRNGYDFNAVRRWTTQRKLGYALIECDKIFVPIHKDIHWCLAVINVKDKTFQYLDPLGAMDTVVLKVLARYFMDEVKDKSNKMIDETSWKQEIVDDLPLQKNGYDCGVFMLKYTDFYSRGLGLYFSQDHMEYFRKRTAKEILKLRAE